MLLFLCIIILLGISLGSTEGGIKAVLKHLMGQKEPNAVLDTIVWKIRFPRVLLATLVGATLSLGGLVFQALLRNPLGLARFPGVSITAFAGSIGTLLLILVMSSGKTILKKDSLLLSGVMVNAFCSAVIMFLVSITHDSRLHNIIFWLMGDLSMGEMRHIGILSAMLLPCFLLIFWFSNTMNLLLLGKEMAQTMGVNIKAATIILLVTTSFMVSVTVSYCGLLGFVGLVMPHLLRLLLGPDHRVLVPACVLGGGAYMVFCDLLARILPEHGEMPAGVITALIGAPLFIFLLKRSKR